MMNEETKNLLRGLASGIENDPFRKKFCKVIDDWFDSGKLSKDGHKVMQDAQSILGDDGRNELARIFRELKNRGMFADFHDNLINS